ncbi:hypothetical protein LLG07_03490 [bacterium]|nr:hypothetical protein [bacterium]
MSAFDERIKKANQLQNEVIKFLDENNIEYILSGYEYLKSSINGRQLITKNNDKTSLFIRHYPDITLIYKDKSCLLEIKNSSGIEKHCYDNYLSLAKMLNINVFLYLKNNKICNIIDLKLLPMNEWDNIAKMNIPVIDGIWKHPKGLNSNDYYMYKNAYLQRGKNTSGNTFAFFDFINTPFFERDVLIIKNK